MNLMEQLLGYVDWAKAHEPVPGQKIHIVEWAYNELVRLYAEKAGASPLLEAVPRPQSAPVELRQMLESLTDQFRFRFRPNPLRLRIIRCPDPSMWYANMVGKVVLCEMLDVDGWWAREPEGHINVIKFEDAFPEATQNL